MLRDRNRNLAIGLSAFLIVLFGLLANAHPTTAKTFASFEFTCLFMMAVMAIIMVLVSIAK